MAYHSSNPSLKKLKQYQDDTLAVEQRASYLGIGLKALYFVSLAIIAAVISAVLLFTKPEIAFVLIFVSLGLSFVFALLAAFIPKALPVLGSLYMIFEGILIGAISAVLNLAYPGIVFLALVSTFGIFAIMTGLFAFGIIKVTHKFRSYMYSALLGIVIINLIILVLSLFLPVVRELFYGNNIFSIAISAFMVLFAAFFILVDLFEIQQTVQGGLPKAMEWRAAYSLTITLIWLYLEILRLLSKIMSRK